MICWGFYLVVHVRPPRSTTQCHVLICPNSEGCKLSGGGALKKGDGRANNTEQWIGSDFSDKPGSLGLQTRLENGEQKGETRAQGGENLPSFKSLSERVMVIGPGEAKGGSGGGRCTSMPQNIIAPGL